MPGAMSSSCGAGKRLCDGIKVRGADLSIGHGDDASHHLGARHSLAGEISLRGPGVMQAKLSREIGDAPPTLTAKFVEGHEARLAIMARPVKANLASDAGSGLGQGGHMLTRLAEVMDARGVQPAALARAASVDPSTLSKLTLGKRKFTREWALKLAHHLGVQPDDLMVEVGRPLPDLHHALPAAQEASTEPPSLPPRNQMPRDVPVLGTAMGANGDGAFEINQTGGVVDMVLRGPGIMHSRKVFAIYVEGDSMMPRHRPGELRYCDAGRPARTGDDVVIVLAATDAGRPPQAFLKELVRRTAAEIITRQSNPEREVRFPIERVKETIRVLTMNEVMGV